MQLRIFTEPQQGADYARLLSVARAAEELGFDAFFRSDHYLTMGGSGLPGPTGRVYRHEIPGDIRSVPAVDPCADRGERH